jgi:charged multivesicular body protein 4A/B
MQQVWNGLSQSWGVLVHGTQVSARWLRQTFGRTIPPTPEEGIQKLRSTLKHIEERQTELAAAVERHDQDVRRHLAGRRRREATLALRRRKVYDKQLEQLQGTATAVESQILGLELTLVNADVYSAMREGASALRGIHRTVGVEQVEDTMQDMADEHDNANEVAASLAQPVGNMFEDFDDDELEAELGALEAGLDMAGPPAAEPPPAEVAPVDGAAEAAEVAPAGGAAGGAAEVSQSWGEQLPEAPTGELSVPGLLVPVLEKNVSQ